MKDYGKSYGLVSVKDDQVKAVLSSKVPTLAEDDPGR